MSKNEISKIELKDSKNKRLLNVTLDDGKEHLLTDLFSHRYSVPFFVVDNEKCVFVEECYEGVFGVKRFNPDRTNGREPNSYKVKVYDPTLNLIATIFECGRINGDQTGLAKRIKGIKSDEGNLEIESSTYEYHREMKNYLSDFQPETGDYGKHNILYVDQDRPVETKKVSSEKIDKIIHETDKELKEKDL
ncbi:hypothetical protein CL618_02130 [archaeon]|nr:hypothetical protein [archaeon]|tara:strand:+ start:3255 stop:3827 length:573 start_codon:yes stop_codon:yes gene_type:complete